MFPFNYARIPLYLDYVKLNEGILGQIKLRNSKISSIFAVWLSLINDQTICGILTNYHGVIISK